MVVFHFHAFSNIILIIVCYDYNMNIAFTGHRDKTVSEKDLDSIAEKYPFAVWIHGGAAGFDSQISSYATLHNIPQITIKPDYSKGRAAPLIRNREIIDRCDILFACYDGRKTGGTLYTIEYAKKKHKAITVLCPI